MPTIDPAPTTSQTLPPVLDEQPQAERGHQTSKPLSDMPQTTQKAAVPLQGRMKEDFHRRPRRLEEIFFDGKRRYRLIYNHLQDWRLPWLPAAKRGSHHARATEPLGAPPRGTHPRCDPATAQLDCPVHPEYGLLVEPDDKSATKVLNNAFGLLTRMDAEHRSTGAPDRQTVIIDDELYVITCKKQQNERLESCNGRRNGIYEGIQKLVAYRTPNGKEIGLTQSRRI
uniref:Uncharacterized protein n=1 Tax=Glossina pallidipes TaxID=7398 RepID=A0A1A9ZPV7_GLOPL